jgi:pyruvate dehydrogenase E2 component (dihydrolipoamide acetyltransferase)
VSTELRLADLGEGLSDARIVAWLVRPGDTVAADQPVVTVETDKAAVELPAPVAGVVGACYGEPGDVVPVGTVLMRYDGDVATEPAPQRLSPGARRRAAAASEGDARVPLSGLRRATALAVAQAWRTIPHVVEFREIDATALVAARTSARANRATLTYLPFFVLAVARALRANSNFNAALDLEREQIVQRSRCNIGIATALDDGLVVPVLGDADRLSLNEAADALERLIGDARAHRPLPQENAAVTITNFGSYGTWLGTPIVRSGEASIVGFGRIRDAVIAVDGTPAVRPVLPIAVAADHRLNDGAALARYAAAIAEACLDPSWISR